MTGQWIQVAEVLAVEGSKQEVALFFVVTDVAERTHVQAKLLDW